MNNTPEQKKTLSPYPADGNMSLELGKYYKEDGTTYECIEATTPLYAKLRDCPRYAKAIE